MPNPNRPPEVLHEHSGINSNKLVFRLTFFFFLNKKEIPKLIDTTTH
jgi:hypothetical protein